MRLQSLRAVQRFTHVYLHARTTVDACDIRTWRTTVILITGNPKDPQFEPHARIKMAQVLGSPVYIYDNTSANSQQSIYDVMNYENFK